MTIFPTCVPLSFSPFFHVSFTVLAFVHLTFSLFFQTLSILVSIIFLSPSFFYSFLFAPCILFSPFPRSPFIYLLIICMYFFFFTFCIFKVSSSSLYSALSCYFSMSHSFVSYFQVFHPILKQLSILGSACHFPSFFTSSTLLSFFFYCFMLFFVSFTTLYSLFLSLFSFQ